MRSGLTLVLAILVVAGLTSGVLFAKEVRADARLRLTGRAETMLVSLADRFDAGLPVERADLERLAPPGAEVVLHERSKIVQTHPILAGEVMSVSVTGPSDVGSLTATVSIDSAPIEHRVHRAWELIAAIAVAIAVAAAAAALLQARQLTRPLDRLVQAAVRLGAGDSGVAVPRSGLAEVDAIADALEDSGNRIDALVTAERQFSANASHQLRSPLTAIAISLELIADSEDPLARHEATEALAQVVGLDQRINDLLELARTGRVAPPARTDVTALVARHVDAVAAQFHRDRRRLKLVAPDMLEANITASALTQAVEILLDNALVHGRGDVAVTVVAGPDDSGIDIAIRDEGEFHGAPTALAGDQRSHGLGLVLARNLLRADGGRVELVSTAPTTFVIRLPGTAPADGRPPSGANFLAHEGGVGRSEQHHDTTDERGDLPPGEHETLGKRKSAGQGL